MIISLGHLAFVLTSSMVVCGLLTPIMRLVALRLSIVDRPNQSHKSHSSPVPYLGGLAIIATILFVVAIGSSLVDLDSSVRKSLYTILVPALIMGFVGLVDDLMNLSPLSRFVAQTASGVFTAVSIITTNTIGSPTGNSGLDFLITVFWIVGINNAVNFFDNHDGGAAGTVAISSLGLVFLSIISSQIYLASLASALAGALLGFLIWNRSPAQIYMGDAGALFIGTLISALLVRLEPSPTNQFASFAIPVLLMAIPIMDTTVAVISRIKNGTSPFKGGQDHLSHRLTRKMISKKKVAIILWSLSFIFTLGAVAISVVSAFWEVSILIGILLLWGCLFVYFFRQD